MLYTPSDRLARVVCVDEEMRVHVIYLPADKKPYEEGCYPLNLVKESHLTRARALHPKAADTKIQHTCGHGDKSLELVYDVPDTRTIQDTDNPMPYRIWTYDNVGRKRGA